MDPSHGCQIISAAVVVTLTGHHSIFWGWSDDRFVSFSYKGSPVTQIFLLLMMCIFSPFPSALPSVCRSLSLLFSSSHTVFCTLASFSLRFLSLYTLSCDLCLGFSLVGNLFIHLFIYYHNCSCFLPFYCNIFSDSSTNLFISCCFLFFPYHGISLTSHQGTCLPQKSSKLWYHS